MTSQTFDDLCEEIFAKKRGAIKPGLERMLEAAGVLNFPLDPPKTKTILIGGTNGKGTTAGFLLKLLRAYGKRVGLYTSPHMVSFKERFITFPDEVSESELIHTLNRLKAKLGADLWRRLTFFEISTLVALVAFEEKNLDYQILEVGLGGRFDATNVVTPTLSVITSVGIDHSEYLGNSLQDIAREKLGIARPSVPLVWGGKPYIDELYELGFGDFIATRNASTLGYGKGFEIKDCSYISHGTEGIRAPLVLPANFNSLPDYLKRNFACAVTAFQMLLRQSQISLTTVELEKIIENSMSLSAFLPSLRGRWEHIKLRPKGWNETIEFVVDVCHNPDGAHAFVDHVLKVSGSKKAKLAFVTMMADKDVPAILKALRRGFQNLILFRTSNHRSFNREHLSAEFANMRIYESFSEALESERARFRGEEPYYICGSVIGIGEVLSYFSANQDI